VVNQTHLNRLEAGYKRWNRWKKENPSITPDLSKADLSGFDLGLFDLRGAKLRSAKLINTRLFAAKLDKADLSHANLSGANLESAQLTDCKLNKANLRKANLREANLRRACLIAADLREVNLGAANLNFADLRQVDLGKADLTFAVMRAVHLQDSNLKAVQALGTDFAEAVFTGACLQDWNLNAKTILDKVQCNYIYLKRSFGGGFIDKCEFQPGEFTKKFQPISEVNELFFPNGIDDLALSFQSLKQLHPDKLFTIEEIEPRSRSSVLVRLKTVLVEDLDVTDYEEQFRLAQATYALQSDISAKAYEEHILDGLERRNISQKISLAQLRRLEKKHSDLESVWDIECEKLKNFRQALVIESGIATKFQLDHEIKAGEQRLEKLEKDLFQLEQSIQQFSFYEEQFSSIG
jgi:Pentapeptide repeats (8 copies)